MLGVQVEALEGRAAAGGTPFVTVSGGREERLAQAVEAIEPLLRFPTLNLSPEPGTEPGPGSGSGPEPEPEPEPAC